MDMGLAMHIKLAYIVLNSLSWLLHTGCAQSWISHPFTKPSCPTYVTWGCARNASASFSTTCWAGTDSSMHGPEHVCVHINHVILLCCSLFCHTLRKLVNNLSTAHGLEHMCQACHTSLLQPPLSYPAWISQPSPTWTTESNSARVK
jgi:hypothetical protein